MDQDAPTDIELHCSICKATYNLSSVHDHRKHHSAMRIMRFKQGSGPRNLESLSKRHKTLMRKVLNKQKELPKDSHLMKRLERITDAYESLRYEFTKDDADLKAMLLKDGKTSMRDGYFEERDRVLEDEIDAQSILTYKQQGYPSCIYGIGRSQAINRDWRDQMEDSLSIKGGVDISSMKNPCYLALFDGHHGSTAAKTCSEKLDVFISEEINEFYDHLSEGSISHGQFTTTSVDDTESHHDNPKNTEIAKCIARAYTKMDRYLGHGINEKSSVRWSGCSALTCVIADEVQKDASHVEKVDEPCDQSRSQPENNDSKVASQSNQKVGQVYISNAGNVQAVLYQNRKPLMLNHCHMLSNDEEHERVIKAGAVTHSNQSRVTINNTIDTTRGLGNHGDLKLKKCVIPIPQTSMVKLTKGSQILVVATNSLWEVLNANDVFSILLHCIPPDAMTVLKSGPIPVFPVMHSHVNAGDKGDGDGRRLPSIVETEEDDVIEEVIYVRAEHSDSEGEEEGEVNGGFGDGYQVTKTRKELHDVDGSMSTYSTDDGSSGIMVDPSVEKEIIMRKQYADIATTLSSHLVRAAIQAGAIENVSVIVVLFEGLFNQG